MKKYLLLLIIVIIALVITQCGQQATPTPQVVKETVVVTQEVEKVVTKEVEVKVEVTPTPAPYSDVPFQALWAGSPHAKADAEAFIHWDKADPAEVPVTCAKCHSTPGYLDFLGADGSAAGKVDKAAPIGTVIRCVACHNDVTLTKTSVVFPSGVEVTGLGDESRCMECHQGRESKVSVDAAIKKVNPANVDTVSKDLGFINIHYRAAAATQEGGVVMGGYQYEGKSYDAKFAHVAQLNTCIGCHNSHSLEIKLDTCKTCHTDVASKEDLSKIRMVGSQMDYDGDGNVQEGINDEIAGLRDLLLKAMQAYAKDVSKTAIAYNPDSYPYFFIDTNGNGAVDKEEADAKNAYKGWTARLIKAAYNYQVSIKDPGAFAHGGKYIIELLYDSIEDLNAGLPAPAVDMANLHRVDAGHFAGSEEAFRHWDTEGVVPATCSRCHSAEGLALYVKDNATISQKPSNGMLCTTCHVSITEGAPRYEVKQVQFPSGLVITATQAASNTLLCMTCHQGRESTVSMNKAIGDLKPDEVSKLSFRNVHYFAAGATRYGTEAKGAYEYEGQKYNGYFAHKEPVSGCTDCHDNHELEVKIKTCSNCHEVKSEEDLQNIRVSEIDYDGDGNKTEGIAGEISTMYEALYKAMQAYATDKAGKPIAYDPTTNPYYFFDTNGNGTVDADEAKSENRYAAWTPRLLRAAYNYQYVTKDPGAFAHNGKYILQVLYDSLKDIGGSVKGMTRPEVIEVKK